MKRIQSACLEQTLVFGSEEQLELYKRQLERRRVAYRLLDSEAQSDGTLCVRMRRRYVNYPTGDYLEDRP